MGRLLDIWAKERRNEITARFAACYLLLLKINGTIERSSSVLLKQYPLHGSGWGLGRRGRGPVCGSACSRTPPSVKQPTHLGPIRAGIYGRAWDCLPHVSPRSILAVYHTGPASAPQGQLIKADFLPCHLRLLLGENVNRKIKIMGTGELAKKPGEERDFPAPCPNCRHTEY